MGGRDAGREAGLRTCHLPRGPAEVVRRTVSVWAQMTGVPDPGTWCCSFTWKVSPGSRREGQDVREREGGEAMKRGHRGSHCGKPLRSTTGRPSARPLPSGAGSSGGLCEPAGGSPSAGRGLAGKRTATRRQACISRCGACRVRPARQASCSHFRSWGSLHQTPSAGVSWEAACTGGNEGKGTGPLAARAPPPVGGAGRV